MSPSLQTMGFFMSDINFCNTKEQLNHLGEVVTGKVGGSPTGADIDTSTLPYTGQVRKTLTALEGEYEQSITDKEAEADAAIDEYRRTNKGDYAPGILLSNNFEFIVYNGLSYFATNPPYTTTATTPDADGNLFLGGYTTFENAKTLTHIGDSAIVGSSIFPANPTESIAEYTGSNPAVGIIPEGTKVFRINGSLAKFRVDITANDEITAINQSEGEVTLSTQGVVKFKGITPSVYDHANAFGVTLANDITTDNSTEIQTVLNALSSGWSGAFPKQKPVMIDFAGLRLMHTVPIVQPPYTACVALGVEPSLNAQAALESETLIYSNLTDTQQSAWISAGKSLNDAFLPVGQQVDPFLDLVGSSTYDNGSVERMYGTSIDGLVFYTDKYVACAVSHTSGPTSSFKFASYGFLWQGYLSSSWKVKFHAVGTSHHGGVVHYNANGSSFDGYLNRAQTGSPPVFDESTAPAGWQSEHPTHNPPSLRFLTCGIAGIFSNAVTYSESITTEEWEKGRLYWSCHGATEVSPYLEDISTLPYHCVDSDVRVITPRLVNVGPLARVSSGGNLTIDMPSDQRQLDFGSQVSTGVSLVGIYTKLSSIFDAEIYNSSVRYELQGDQMRYVYVNSDTGLDTYTGLAPQNAVRTLEEAVIRCNEQGITHIKLAGGGVVQSGDTVAYTNDSPLFIDTDDSTSLNFKVSSGNLRRLEATGDVVITDVTITTDAGAASLSNRVCFRPIGTLNLILNNCDTTIEVGGGLLGAASSSASNITLTVNGGSLNAEVLAHNPGTTAVSTIITTINSNTTGALTIGGNYRVI